METTKLNAFTIIGITVRTNINNGKAAKDIPALWKQFMAEDVFDKIPKKLVKKFTLYTPPITKEIILWIILPLLAVK